MRFAGVLAPLFLASVGLVTACGGEGPSPVAPLTSAAAAPPAKAAPAAPPPDAEPTVLTGEQRARDKALETKAAAIIDAFTNSVVALSKDGKRFAFVSSRDGVPEVFLGEVGKPDAPPKRLTTGPERAVLVDFTPDDKGVFFLRDEGADENFRLYRVGLDGGAPVSLTPGEKLHRDAPVFPRDDRKRMFYTVHKATSPGSTLVVQPVDGGEPKTVYTDPAPAYCLDVTADGKRALLLRWISASDLVAFEVEIASGKTTRLYPAEGKKADVEDVRYSVDGKRVFIASDDGAEGHFVFALEVGTGAVKAQYKQDSPPTAFVAAIQVAPKGERLAIGINAGDHSEVKLLDARTLGVVKAVKTPLGRVDPYPFTADGKHLGAMVSTPDQPADVFVIDADSGEMKPLRADQRPGFEGLAPMTTSLEKIAAFDGLNVPVNLYLPKVAAGTKLPAVVSVHGGPSSSSQIRWNPITRFLVSQGYAVVEPNIRGSTGFGRAYEMADDREKRGDALKDLESVNRWTKAQPWCDASRVVLLGGSYGGYITLMGLTRQPSLWRAGVDLYGVADLKTVLRTTDQAIRAAFVDEFGDLDKDAALLEQYSPMRDVDKIVAPLFVYAGQNDPRVPRSESDTIVKALRGRKIPVEYMVAANEGHSLDREETKIALFTRMARFLSDNAK